MKRYDILPLTAPLPALAGAAFDPGTEPFCRRPYAAIDCYAWGGEYRPEARAYVAWDASGLHVLLCAREETIVAKAKAFDGDVWLDSCLEFFFRPFEDDPRYINIETNAAGAALIGIGPHRDDRVRLSECPPGMNFRASAHCGGWWAVAYAVPNAVIEGWFGRPLTAGSALRGNFYKCDETLHPHFGSWSPVEAPEPDFHQPDFFGELRLAE